jgi:hypothetical protein
VSAKVHRALQLWLPLRLKRRVLFLWFHRRWGNFRNPRTFSEKVNWRILNDRRPELIWTCDKLEMKERALAAGIHVPQTYWYGDNISTLAKATLPERWVLKPNHRSSLVYFGRGTPNMEEIESLTAGWTDEVQCRLLGEWAYSQARPILFVEEQLEPDATLFEYKFFVMDGSTVIIQVDADRFGDHRRNVYTPEWEPVDTQFLCQMGDPVPLPDKLFDMTCAAERMAGDLDFLRVDLYYVKGNIYFGEVAAYPGSGLVRHKPYSSNVILGSYWHLPNLKRGTLLEP